MKTTVKISESERGEMRSLFERGQALQAKSACLTKEDAVLMEQLLDEMTDSVSKSDDWWKKMTEKYHLDSSSEGCWEINFDKCEIILEDPKET